MFTDGPAQVAGKRFPGHLMYFSSYMKYVKKAQDLIIISIKL